MRGSVISHWKQEFIERFPQSFQRSPERNERSQRIAELERMVGRLTMVEVSKKSPASWVLDSRERMLVKQMNVEGYPVCVSCDVLDLSRSSYYYQAEEVNEAETEIETAIEEIAGQFPAHGTHRIAQQLRRPPYELRVNRNRARRIMAAKALLQPAKRQKRHTTNSQHLNLAI